MFRTLDDVTKAFLTYAPPDMKGKYQLDRMHQLMAFLGNPQDGLRVIHIAGTSGKTSTAYFIRGFLEAAGAKTGLTVSPHIVAVNERVQIGGLPLNEQRFLDYANHFLPMISETKLEPTYFELFIAFAYWVFAQEKVDYAVIETGLGGLLDGTNVVSRPDKICVITDIGLDHTEILGETVAEIAAQKAGIIQPKNHVIVRQQSDEILDVIIQAAKKQRATVALVTNEDAPASLPHFQHRNWAVAKAAFDYVARRDTLPTFPIAKLDQVARQTPPGRWEQYHYKGKTIIIDGAHNPQKLQALCNSLTAAHITSAAILANLIEAPAAKINAALAILQPFASHLIIPEFQTGQDLKSRRSVTVDRMKELAKEQNFGSVETQPDITIALQTLLKRPEKTLVITGSLYLVSTLRPQLMRLFSKG